MKNASRKQKKYMRNVTNVTQLKKSILLLAQLLHTYTETAACILKCKRLLRCKQTVSADNANENNHSRNQLTYNQI